MTLERATEIVSALREAGNADAAIDLFSHFEEYFRVAERGPDALENFAVMCGFPIARDVRPL